MIQHIGNTIKYYRLKLNMTQSELAKGIISVSYLSKIENGYVEPSREIVELLCKKLNIIWSDKEDKQIFEWCNKWFKALFHKNIQETCTHFKQIEDNMSLIANNGLLNLIEIHKLRYLLLKDKNKAKEQYNKLKEILNLFNEREMYYWLKFSGYYYLTNFFYHKSLNNFLAAENYLEHSFYMEFEERYHLHYMIGLSASFAKKSHLAFEYTRKALDHYQKDYKLKESAKCHILLGYTFLQMNGFKQALKNYQTAKKIANHINNKKLLMKSVQRIGDLYSKLNKPQEALEYYLKSYELQASSNTKTLVPILSLIKEHYKKHDIAKAKKWLEKGIELLAEAQVETIYLYELKVYEQLIKGIKLSFDKLILHEIIPFLDERKLYDKKIIMLQLLADYYFDNRKYKLAASYYNYALQIKNKLEMDRDNIYEIVSHME
ncbi:helix-turn-helix domain-containing protein [Cerasibacillus sp. JNUCC 74]